MQFSFTELRRKWDGVANVFIDNQIHRRRVKAYILALHNHGEVVKCYRDKWPRMWLCHRKPRLLDYFQTSLFPAQVKKMSRIREIEDQIPKHFSKNVQDKIRKHLLKDYHARATQCCGFDMTERKDFDGQPIYWCSSCGKKKPRSSSRWKNG